MIQATDLVLVAILKDPRDLDIVRTLGWYRIPLRFAPKIVSVDALAFYQTAAFPSEKWSICHAARVRGIELVTRADLFHDQADHPRAQEEYYKFQLSPLEDLPRPIPARNWRRITFLYTTGERLLAARDAEGLAVSGEERDVLWRTMRDRATEPDSGYTAGGKITDRLPRDVSMEEIMQILAMGRGGEAREG